MLRRLLLMFLLGILLPGCGPKLIPGLPIELADTNDHRALLTVLESFRQAFQNKDVEALTALASPRFFEDSGSTSNKDDYSFDGLRTHFTEHFKNTKQCVLDLQVKDVVVDGDTAHIDYHYSARYQMVLPAGERWQVSDDINRMELTREKGEWRILSGI